MTIETNHPFIETILASWQDRIGSAYPGYKGHVYRIYNFCLALGPCTETDKTKLAIAACFHHIGLWSDHQFYYIPASVTQVTRYLTESGLDSWSEELGQMIETHHDQQGKIDGRNQLAELLRKSNLIELSFGMFTFGLSRSYVRNVRRSIPNKGFHKAFMKGAMKWILMYPFGLAAPVKW